MSYGMFGIERYAASAWSALPCEAAVLRLVSLSSDTLTLGGLDYAALAVKQPVRVMRGSETVFSGEVSRIGRDTRRGRRQRQTATVSGLWRKLERTLFTQPWMMWVYTEEHPEGSWQIRSTGRAVLNQSDGGGTVTVRTQLHEILAACPATAASVATSAAADETFAGFPDLTLPFDEVRDLYCSAALQKELRFTPRAASRIDYSAGGPFIRFRCPDSQTADAGWLADYAAAGKLVVIGEGETDDPPEGVQIEIETGGDKRGITMQEAGTVSDPAATLRACLSLAGRSGSSRYRHLDVVTEDAPETSAEGSVDFTTGAPAQWLINHCASLRGLNVAEVAAGAISRSGEADKALYPRITSVPIPDLTAAGIRARLETFTANVNIILESDDGTSTRTEITKMRVVLSLITTSAETKRYSWRESYSSFAAETAPDGLAAALLGHLADCGRTADVAVRITPGLDIPRPGDCRSGLPCQSVEIDLKRETALASFGAPSHLSAADLASVLSGFRNLRRAGVWGSARADGEPSEEDSEPATFVCPVSEETFSLGSYERIGASKEGKKVDANPADLADEGAEAKFRTIEFKDKNGNTQNAQILATEPKSGEAEEPADPCNDHPEGGDGVGIGPDGSGALIGQGGGEGGVPIGDDGSSSGVPLCATQCKC